MGTSKKEWLEDITIIAGSIWMQFMYAGNSVLVSYLMNRGFQPSFLIIMYSLATFVILSPFSFLFERSQWPKRFRLQLWIQLVVISFSGVTLFQSLFLKGINLTSPAIATAMPNLAPGFTFFIAWAARLEKVELRCIYSRAKIAGTLLCVVGAVLMSLIQSLKNSHTVKEAQISEKSPPADILFDKNQIIGCLYLMVAVFILSGTIVLQAATLGEFPSPISLSAITSLIGGILTGFVQIMKDGSIDNGWAVLSIMDLIGYSLLAGCIGGGCATFNVWAMKKRGPVLVSIFSPVGTVSSIILSVITLGHSIAMGSVAGMCILFTGLYFVLWAKGKEGFSTNSDDFSESENDVENPLLS